MDLVTMRERLAAILAQLETFATIGMMNDEQVSEFNELNDEFEALKKNIEAKEKLEKIQASTTVSNRQTAPTQPVARVEINARHDRMGGFKSAGEFLMSVKRAANGDVDKRFHNTAAFEKNGEDGGFLVPEEFSSDITKKLSSDESLLAKTRQIRIMGNSLTIPVDESSPWSGGVTSYWVAEGQPITESKAKFGQASWRLHKQAVLVKATDELLDDATALESYIRMAAPDALMHKLNEAILIGDGVGKPTGIINSLFKVKVAKESAQTADTIVAKNIIKMYSKMLPISRGNAVWYINPACEEQLRIMKDDANNYIYLAAGSQMNQGPYALLLGRPVIPLIGGIKALGDEGDIIFADLSYYYSIIKATGVKSAVSTHLLFDRDQTAFKFTFRVDGSCPFKSPVTTQYGAYEMSAFVTLEDR